MRNYNAAGSAANATALPAGERSRRRRLVAAAQLARYNLITHNYHRQQVGVAMQIKLFIIINPLNCVDVFCCFNLATIVL